MKESARCRGRGGCTGNLRDGECFSIRAISFVEYGFRRKDYAKTKAKRSSVDISRDKSSQTNDRSMQAAGLPSVVISRLRHS